MDLNQHQALLDALKGGVIMDVVDEKQAEIAMQAQAVAVMALERVPADLRKEGGVARMSDPALIEAIMKRVKIPVMAKVRIGHSLEARILEALKIDMIDESEVLTPADHSAHVDKTAFTSPFVCGAKDLAQALRRIEEGAAMIRTKGEAGTGDVSEAVKHMRAMQADIKRIQAMDKVKMKLYAEEIGVTYQLVKTVKAKGRLPVLNFAAGGVATPADAALMMALGCDGVFVGSGIFKSAHPEKTAKAIVEAVKHYDDAQKLLAISKGLGSAMKGTSAQDVESRYQDR